MKHREVGAQKIAFGWEMPAAKRVERKEVCLLDPRRDDDRSLQNLHLKMAAALPAWRSRYTAAASRTALSEGSGVSHLVRQGEEKTAAAEPLTGATLPDTGIPALRNTESRLT